MITKAVKGKGEDKGILIASLTNGEIRDSVYVRLRETGFLLKLLSESGEEPRILSPC